MPFYANISRILYTYAYVYQVIDSQTADHKMKYFTLHAGNFTLYSASVIISDVVIWFCEISLPLRLWYVWLYIHSREFKGAFGNSAVMISSADQSVNDWISQFIKTLNLILNCLGQMGIFLILELLSYRNNRMCAGLNLANCHVYAAPATTQPPRPYATNESSKRVLLCRILASYSNSTTPARENCTGCVMASWQSLPT